MEKNSIFRIGTSVSAVTKLIELPLYFSMDIAKIINLTLIKKKWQTTFHSYVSGSSEA
jgi:hypothetical protein